MINETEAPETVFSDHDPEAVILALEGQVDAQAARIAELDRAVLIEANHVDRLRKERDREKARAEAAEAKLAKAVKLMELSVELATWNTTLLDDVIFFITELKESDA